MSMIEQIKAAKGAIITNSGDTRFFVSLMFIDDGQINILPLHAEFDEPLLADMVKYNGENHDIPSHYFRLNGEGYNKYGVIQRELKKHNPNLNFWFVGKLRMYNIS